VKTLESIAIGLGFIALITGILYFFGAALTSILELGGWHFPWSFVIGHWSLVIGGPSIRSH
jgi:hypothetical protein